MVKEYEIQYFDKYNTKFVCNLIKFLLEIFPELSIKVFNELDGFYHNLNEKSLLKELNKLSHQYTGLDEIILEKESFPILAIVLHENLCILKLDIKTKEKLEKNFGIKLIKYKKINIRK